MDGLDGGGLGAVGLEGEMVKESASEEEPEGWCGDDDEAPERTCSAVEQEGRPWHGWSRARDPKQPKPWLGTLGSYRKVEGLEGWSRPPAPTNPQVGGEGQLLQLSTPALVPLITGMRRQRCSLQLERSIVGLPDWSVSMIH